ncbi:MAG: hypothetical protein ACUVWR_18330 [Anaerolineae bacterium]
MDRQVPFAWLNDLQTMLGRAREKALRLWNEAPNLCPLGGGQRQETLWLLAVADRALG